MYMQEPTISFSIHEDREKEVKQILTTVYDALRQKGYNPINQIVGYILSEDPTYITTYNLSLIHICVCSCGKKLGGTAEEWPFVPLWTEGFFISPAPWKASHFPILIKR